MVDTQIEIEPTQKTRAKNFNNSLAAIYQRFDIEKCPRPKIADRLFSEWRSSDEAHDNSPFTNPDVPGLILFGPPRTGKTQIACSLARLCLKSFNGIDARVYSAVEWAAEASGRAMKCELKGWARSLVSFAWRGDSDEGIVILDDLDKLRCTPAVQSELFALIEQITANKLRLIVTTNVSGEGLAKKFAPEFGSAIVSRLREFCVPVDFNLEAIP